ncbi:extracellular solute-binding protein [Paenibacillus sp. J5C_2022]|uniref:ABC transporter substrate-binding protein n=1 Tax=Paenibacillus sp. J5C2022 TaxID=2977129 RepID=UPI0021D340A0|nr:extracellular solute-binding protein [Paenibacillus sp. J5C2022]MCU6712725.1 extracellular solute-binding protein [Paenibacillus sp. J5C2022]
MKKSWMLLLALTMLVSIIAGCAGKNEKKEIPKASDPPAEESGAPVSDSANEEAFTIRLGAWFIDDRPHMQQFKNDVDKRYKEKYPNATIQWDILLGATYFDKLKAELASETASDVMFIQGLAQYAEAGYLADLSDQPWASQLQPGGKKDAMHLGKTYAVPMGLATSGVWYNKKIFSDLGISAPANAKEFMAAAEKIKAAGITPVAAGFKDAWTASLFYGLWLQSYGYESSKTYGKDLYDGTKKIDGPEVQAVMNHIQEMAQKGYFNKTALSIDWPQSAELFTSGQAAMIAQGPWMPGTAQENFKTKGHNEFEMGYIPLSTESGYYNLSLGADASLGINAKTELMQPAKDLIATIVSPEIYGPYNVGNGNIPAIKGIDVTFPDAAMNDLLAAVNSGEANFGFGSYIAPSVDTALTETVTKILSGLKFNTNDLAEVQKVLEKDKGVVILPPE